MAMLADVAVRAGGFRKVSASGVLAVCLVAMLVLAQGGFFAVGACSAGVVACVAGGVIWLRKPRRGQGLSLVPLLLECLVAAYVVSALRAGATLTTLAEAGSWAVCAGLSLVVASQDGPAYEGMLESLAWVGVLSAIGGLLTYAGVIPVTEGVVEGRLQFTFQYANAAGAWYASCACLCLVLPSERLGSVAFVPATAFLLTQSGGALLAFLVIALVIVGHWASEGRSGDIVLGLVEGGAAVLLFVLIGTSAAFGIVVAVVLLAALLRVGPRVRGYFEGLDARVVGISLTVLMAIGLAAALLALPARVDGALYSITERMHHIHDGIALWSTSPLLGVGPDNWQYLYKYVQTAAYSVSVAHSSAVQVMLDAGLLGLVCLVAAVALGARGLLGDVRGLGTRSSFAELCVVLLLSVHSLIEFDLQFAALSALLTLMISGPASARLQGGPVARGVVAGALSVLLCLPAGAVGLGCSVYASALRRANQQENYEACVRLFASMPLSRTDVGAQEEYMKACVLLGDYGAALDAYGQMTAPSGECVLFAATASAAIGDGASATSMLAERLEATPYDEGFLDGALRYAERFGMDPSQAGRFQAAVARSESLIYGVGDHAEGAA